MNLNEVLLIVIVIGLAVIIVLSILLFLVCRRHSRLRIRLSGLVEQEQVEVHRNAYRRSQRDLQQMIDALPWPMCIIGPEESLVYYENDAFKNRFCSFSKEKTEYHIWNMMPEKQSDGVSSHESIRQFVWQVLQAQVPVTCEQEYQSSKKEIILMRAVGTEIDYKGKPSISMILQDISAEKREEELLRSLAGKEREASELKSKFIISMSHEIRTPMNGIMGMADIQVEKSHDPEMRDAFKKISLSARQLLAIVNDILDYSKIEAGKLILAKEEFMLENTVYDAMLTANEKIGDKKVEMLLRMERDVPRKVIGDAIRMWQILQNVLDNAAKYTEQGSVILDVSVDGRTSDAQTLVFRLTDTGRGMTPKQLESVFTPFEQFGTKDWKNSGTGLGLPITRQLVELMGGEISLTSEEGRGTVVCLRIPFGNSEWDEPAIEAKDYSILCGKDILLFDMAPESARVSTELLNSVGALAEGISSYAALSDRINEKKNSGSEYDIIVLDPGIEGAWLKELKRSPFNKTKLITMQKPYKPTHFLDRLSALLGGVSQAYKLKNKKYHFNKARILVCEDNAINQDVIMGILQLYGIQAVIAANGQEGISWLDKEEFDMVIMDLMMPVMDGREATRMIRSSDKSYRDIPIIAMTANAMDEEMAICLQEGMNGYVTKPVELERLYRELLKWLPVSVREEAEEAYVLNPAEDRTDEDTYSRKNVLEKLDIDVEEATARFGGKYDLYCKSLRKFAMDIEQNGIMGIAEASESEPEELRKYVHGLKGVTANLSMKEDNRLLRELEKTIRDGAPNMDLYRQLHQHLSGAANEILLVIGTEERKKINLESGNWDECRELLTGLKEYLSIGKARECEQLIARIREKSWENVDSELLEKICGLVEGYDYTKALEILNKIL